VQELRRAVAEYDMIAKIYGNTEIYAEIYGYDIRDVVD